MQLYFIALLPPADIQREVTAFKQTALERFGSGHALRSPPHITLIPPFRRDQTDFAPLQTLADRQVPFPVSLRDFDRFGRRVIFVNVLPSEFLSACQQQIAEFCRTTYAVEPDRRPFHPHMTVAFRDLTQSAFPGAWAYFSAQSYDRRFTADAFALLRHTGQGWVVEQQFMFGGT
ncbi:2'-5' RNA ligase family protein [Fibrisoma montanum]|uniref:2'-5' RNA ligase family protein n=1 Tax=Fibrisoma montanum TaxID=2305895 RepID=A0A418M058_9BACT|nr:2'-5' RNA ligase family protein [Fibrisoma montanum]RIV18967.1 2'-5' RNA ligase family protein [Fibrisoma montanum]